MFVGKVIGTVWSSVKWPGVSGLKLLAVRPYHLSELLPGGGGGEVCSDLVVCADTLDAGVGDEVVVAYGHAARVALEEQLGPTDLPGHPIDAAVVAVVDRMDVAPSALGDPAQTSTAGGRSLRGDS